MQQLRRHRHAASPVAMLLVVLGSSCGPAAPVSPSPGAAAPSSVESTPSASPTAAAIPDELLGEWEAVISTGEEVTLTLGRGSYQVRRGDATGSGSIAVDGTVITFRSPRCDLGAGTYEWTVEGDGLTFASLEPRDPCAGRIIFLEDAAYTRIE